MTSSSQTQRTFQDRGWALVRSAGPFMTLVGPLWARKEDDAWAYALLATEKHLNPGGMVHGGLLETLIDHALSALAWEATERSPCVTVQLDTHLLSSVHPGDFIEARGRMTRRTSSLAFLQGSLQVHGREVLIAQALMKIQAKHAS